MSVEGKQILDSMQTLLGALNSQGSAELRGDKIVFEIPEEETKKNLGRFLVLDIGATRLDDAAENVRKYEVSCSDKLAQQISKKLNPPTPKKEPSGDRLLPKKSEQATNNPPANTKTDASAGAESASSTSSGETKEQKEKTEGKKEQTEQSDGADAKTTAENSDPQHADSAVDSGGFSISLSTATEDLKVEEELIQQQTQAQGQKPFKQEEPAQAKTAEPDQKSDSEALKIETKPEPERKLSADAQAREVTAEAKLREEAETARAVATEQAHLSAEKQKQEQEAEAKRVAEQQKAEEENRTREEKEAKDKAKEEEKPEHEKEPSEEAAEAASEPAEPEKEVASRAADSAKEDEVELGAGDPSATASEGVSKDAPKAEKSILDRIKKMVKGSEDLSKSYGSGGEASPTFFTGADPASADKKKKSSAKGAKNNKFSINEIANFFTAAIKAHNEEYSYESGYTVSKSTFRKSFTVNDKDGQEVALVDKDENKAIRYTFSQGVKFGLADIVLRAAAASKDQELTLHSSKPEDIEAILKAAATPPNNGKVKIKLDEATQKFLAHKDRSELAKYSFISSRMGIDSAGQSIQKKEQEAEKNGKRLKR